MFVTILTHIMAILRKLMLWSLVTMAISFVSGVVIYLIDSKWANGFFNSYVGPFAVIEIFAVFFLAPMALLILWSLLLVTLKILRGVDLIFTYPAVGEVISTKSTGLFINNVPEYAVKMRIKGSNTITECCICDFFGAAVEGEYNIRVSRLNPAVAKIVSSRAERGMSFPTVNNASAATDADAAIPQWLPANAQTLINDIVARAQASGATVTTSFTVENGSAAHTSAIPTGLVTPEVMAQWMAASGSALTPTTATILAIHEVPLPIGSPIGSAPGGLWDITLDIAGSGQNPGYTAVVRSGFSSAARRDAIAQVGATLPVLADLSNPSRVTIDVSRLPL